jgi:hypothetical protein
VKEVKEVREEPDIKMSLRAEPREAWQSPAYSQTRLPRHFVPRNDKIKNRCSLNNSKLKTRNSKLAQFSIDLMH